MSKYLFGKICVEDLNELVIIPMDGLAFSPEMLEIQQKRNKQHAFLPANELALKTC